MKSRLLLFGLSACLAAAELKFEAGVARIDITPSVSMPMYGYANRKCGPSNGVHDPLYAKALVLSAGDTKMAIVTLDLGSIWSETLHRDVAARLGIPVLLLAASHTHSGPSFLPARSSPVVSMPLKADPPPYFKELEDKIFQAIQEAGARMFPARLRAAKGSLQLGYNRLLPREDGRSRALFDNLDRVPYGPLDPEFILLSVDNLQGESKALLVHYAAHPVVLGPTNCKISADFAGVMQSKVEAGLPGSQAMFVQGGAGDVNPLFQGRTGDEEKDFALVQKMGDLLAAQVLRTARDLKPLKTVEHPIEAKVESHRFADRWDREKSLEVGIATVLINREIGIAAVPGEPLHRLQTYWKQNADVPLPLFFGYTYSGSGVWPGYIPDVRSAAYGGYGADASTRIEVGAGEKIMQRHVINLYGLLGMWRDQPGRP